MTDHTEASNSQEAPASIEGLLGLAYDNALKQGLTTPGANELIFTISHGSYLGNQLQWTASVGRDMTTAATPFEALTWQAMAFAYNGQPTPDISNWIKQSKKAMDEINGLINSIAWQAPSTPLHLDIKRIDGNLKIAIRAYSGHVYIVRSFETKSLTDQLKEVKDIFEAQLRRDLHTHRDSDTDSQS